MAVHLHFDESGRNRTLGRLGDWVLFAAAMALLVTLPGCGLLTAYARAAQLFATLVCASLGILGVIACAAGARKLSARRGPAGVGLVLVGGLLTLGCAWGLWDIWTPRAPAPGRYPDARIEAYGQPSPALPEPR